MTGPRPSRPAMPLPPGLEPIEASPLAGPAPTFIVDIRLPSIRDKVILITTSNCQTDIGVFLAGSRLDTHIHSVDIARWHPQYGWIFRVNLDYIGECFITLSPPTQDLSAQSLTWESIPDDLASPAGPTA